jgi:undecaprenyl-diphosphatase
MVVQIVSESLPISSSGHVLLLQRLIEKFDINFDIDQNFWTFDYLLQGVSAFIFLIYFFPFWWELIIKKPINFYYLLDMDLLRKSIFSVFLFGIIADGITFLLWSLQIGEFSNFPLAFGFMITAVVLWSMQFTQSKKGIDIWSPKYALIVGLVQGFALLPGISRFGTTVATLQWLGYKGSVAFAISFLIQWPLIVVGSIKGFCSLHNRSILKTIWSMPFLMIVFIAGYVGYRILYFIEKIINKNLLWKFSYYMIIPIVIALWI